MQTVMGCSAEPARQPLRGFSTASTSVRPSPFGPASSAAAALRPARACVGVGVCAPPPSPTPVPALLSPSPPPPPWSWTLRPSLPLSPAVTPPCAANCQFAAAPLSSSTSPLVAALRSPAVEAGFGVHDGVGDDGARGFRYANALPWLSAAGLPTVIGHGGGGGGGVRGQRRTGSGGARAADADDERAHYKTEMCRTHVATGRCVFAGGCAFAHSFEELRPRHYDPKYKTELCKRFHTPGAGGCRFGARCKFLHDELRVKAADGEYWLCSEAEAIVRVEVIPAHHRHRRALLDQLTQEPPSGPVSPLPKSEGAGTRRPSPQPPLRPGGSRAFSTAAPHYAPHSLCSASALSTPTGLSAQFPQPRPA